MKKGICESTFREEIIQLHLEEGRPISSLNAEYQLGSGTIITGLKLMVRNVPLFLKTRRKRYICRNA